MSAPLALHIGPARVATFLNERERESMIMVSTPGLSGTDPYDAMVAFADVCGAAIMTGFGRADTIRVDDPAPEVRVLIDFAGFGANRAAHLALPGGTGIDFTPSSGEWADRALTAGRVQLVIGFRAHPEGMSTDEYRERCGASHFGLMYAPAFGREQRV